jgi:hypothetical protein
MQIKTVAILTTVALFFLSACDKKVEGETGKPFVMKAGQQAGIVDNLNQRTLMVRFDEVVEDSRCPEGAYCFWAGRAIVAVSINGERLQLMAADADSAWVAWKDYKVRCKALTPYPTVKDKTRKNPNKGKEAMLEIQ